MRVLGLICMAAGSVIFFLAGLVWWPGVGEEWPGLIPFITILGSFILIFVGYRLWTGKDLPPD